MQHARRHSLSAFGERDGVTGLRFAPVMERPRPLTPSLSVWERGPAGSAAPLQFNLTKTHSRSAIDQRLYRARARTSGVGDFTTGDARRFCDRLGMADRRGRTVQAAKHHSRELVLLLHGLATQFAARTLSGSSSRSRPQRIFPPPMSGSGGLLRLAAALKSVASPWSGVASHPRTFLSASPSSATCS